MASIGITLHEYLRQSWEQARGFLIDELDQLETTLSTTIVPSGVIVLWPGALSAVPAGWAVCNGTQGTPNLTAFNVGPTVFIQKT